MPFDDDIERILRIIKAAIDQVSPEFYKLQTTYSREGIVRERIFCYELYHLMRSEQQRLNLEDVFSLHGEIDKSGHEEFAPGDRKNPDFVFHVPGEMRSNSLVLEVKGIIQPQKIKKDFETLYRFTSQYQYKAGVFLLYNHSSEELRQRMSSIDLSEIESTENIEILCKKDYETPLEVIPFSYIINRNDI